MQRRPTTQDISWFLDLHGNKQLELDPAYQRHSVWTLKDRRFFLDTIFSGYPCPAVFLHKRMDENGRSIYDVVDGKQRLETILMFANNKLSIDTTFTDARIAGKKFRDLDEPTRHKFWNYVLPVEYLDFSAGETATVGEAFDRLNRNSRKLEPQELRHARFDGWLATTVETETADLFWRNIGVVTNARAKRMKDAQFISELLLVLIERAQVGFDQKHIDGMYAKYDDPDEEGAEFDEDAFAEDLAASKQFLMEANAVNGAVKTAAATVGAFYTLWSLVALHRANLPAPDEFGSAYAGFVGLVAQVREGRTQDQLSFPQVREDWLELAVAYAIGLQGAHTDLGPRNVRLVNLLAAMRVP